MVHNVFNARCELVITNQNMKYRNVLTFVLVQGQVNRNFQLVLNEMGPDRTSRSWYFHSSAGKWTISFRGECVIEGFSYLSEVEARGLLNLEKKKRLDHQNWENLIQS